MPLALAVHEHPFGNTLDPDQSGPGALRIAQAILPGRADPFPDQRRLWAA
jgi:hypothetical protein